MVDMNLRALLVIGGLGLATLAPGYAKGDRPQSKQSECQARHEEAKKVRPRKYKAPKKSKKPKSARLWRKARLKGPPGPEPSDIESQRGIASPNRPK